MAGKQYTLKSTFTQSFASLLFDSAGLLAGGITSLVAVFVVNMPWILIIYPPLLTVRGNVNGIYSGRFTTGLHVGQIKPRIRKNTDYFRSLVASIYCMSFLNAIAISFFSYMVYKIISPSTTMSLQVISRIVFVAMLVPSTVSIFIITPFVSIIAYKKGADPDVIVYPVMSTVNDIFISAIYVIVIYLFIFNQPLFILLSSVMIVFFFILLLNSLRFVKDREFKRTLMEGLPTVLVLSFLSNFTGGLLSQFRYQIAEYPHLLILYPSLCTAMMIIFNHKGKTRYSLPGLQKALRQTCQGSRRVPVTISLNL